MAEVWTPDRLGPAGQPAVAGVKGERAVCAAAAPVADVGGRVTDDHYPAVLEVKAGTAGREADVRGRGKGGGFGPEDQTCMLDECKAGTKPVLTLTQTLTMVLTQANPNPNPTRYEVLMGFLAS